MDELKQLAALKEFDKMNKKYNAEAILGYKIVGIIFGIIGIFLVMIPIQEFGLKDITMHIIPFMFFWMIHFMYYNNWQVIGIGKQSLSIYEVLKELPISPSVIRRDRAKKILLFDIKITAVFIVIQIFSSLIFIHELTVWNIVVPLLYGLCTYSISYLLVKVTGMC